MNAYERIVGFVPSMDSIDRSDLFRRQLLVVRETVLIMFRNQLLSSDHVREFEMLLQAEYADERRHVEPGLFLKAFLERTV